ncbi:MAG: DegT/DnrJ/EryC1/StrS aminotransferase family protein [Bdellovibrionota bacterium]
MRVKDEKRADYIVFGQPRLSDEEIQAVTRTLRSGWIGTGPRSKEFESAFAAYQGADHAAAVSSCTAALNLSLRAFGIGQGDEVITTAMTFAATVNAIIHAGATPVLVDVNPLTQNIDIEKVRQAITPRTRAIVPVHFAGLACDMDALMELRSRYNLKLVHDCAHAIETEWKGRHIGSYGDAVCYSFYSTKNITTIEGGMVCSPDSAFIDKLRLLSYQGMSKDAWKRYSNHGYNHYDIVTNGFKLNMTDVQASLGLEQLKTVEDHYRRRKEIWDVYQKAFKTTQLAMPSYESSLSRHAYHLYTPMVDADVCGVDADEMRVMLHERGIGTGCHYRSIPAMSYYNDIYGWNPDQYPVANQIGNQTISLPLTPYLTDIEVMRVIMKVMEILAIGAERLRHRDKKAA